MTFTEVLVALVASGAFLSAAMAGAWAVERRTGNSGWVDTAWTFSVGLAGLTAAALAWMANSTTRSLLVGACVLIWSLRLGSHIARRSSGIADDPRYAELKRGWGADAGREMFWLLQKQALVSMPLVMAIALAAWNPAAGLRLQDAVALCVLTLAVIGEGVADGQLRAFGSDPGNRGKVCDVGLWRLSRHPNYFFEWLGWLAYPLFAIEYSGAHPWGWLALLGPLCMYWLLVYVSGIPPLERHMRSTRGEAYARYQARTSAFLPWPPRPLGSMR